jgi:KAP-like P-loop domain-containing protein
VKRPELNSETTLQTWNDLVGKLIQTELKMQTVETSESEKAEYKQDRLKEARLWETMKADAQKNVVSVTFNAWQFEDSKQTWAGLASQVSRTIETTLPWHSRQWLKLNYTWKERKRELILTLLLPAAVVCIVAGLVRVGFFSQIGIGKPEGAGLLLPAGSVLLTIWFVSSQLLKVAVPISERVLSYVRMPDYREQMGFQHRVRDDLKFLHTFLLKRRPGCRVVVYIDDLDRCSENKIMEILQAINLILASSEFFVFVGMDTEMIYRAIKSYYKEQVPERFPENYLSKIIQISFYLPEITQARQSYLSTLFSANARRGLLSTPKANGDNSPTAAPAVPSSDGSLPFDSSSILTIVPVQLREVEDTADELQAFQDYSDFLEDNPREVKRLINIHRLIKILLQKQKTSWSSERQRKLVKWLIFCERWPHLVDDVLRLKKSSSSSDYLLQLSKDLTNLKEKPQSTEPVPDFDRLEEFAKFSAPKKPPDPLSDKDLDEDFRLAAYLSQLVRKQ